MLGGILYRPIFGSFLKDTAIKEWKKTDPANMVVVEKKSKADTLLDTENGLRIQIQNEDFPGTTKAPASMKKVQIPWW